MMPTLSGRWSALLSDPFAAVRQELADRSEPAPSGFGAMAYWEDEGQYLIEMDLPGVQLEDLDISVEKGHLWIRAQRRVAEAARSNWYEERRFGSLQKAVRLSDEIDPSAIDATLKDGVLRLTVAKKPEHRPRRVAVRGEQQKRLATE